MPTIRFVTDSVEVTPRKVGIGAACGCSLQVSVNISLSDLLEGVTDKELLDIMDIDNVRAWLQAKGGV